MNNAFKLIIWLFHSSIFDILSGFFYIVSIVLQELLGIPKAEFWSCSISVDLHICLSYCFLISYAFLCFCHLLFSLYLFHIVYAYHTNKYHDFNLSQWVNTEKKIRAQFWISAQETIFQVFCTFVHKTTNL